MLRALKHLWPGLALITLAAGILLCSDLDRRQRSQPRRAQHLPAIAIMQFCSAMPQDDSVTGIMEELRRSGYEDGRTAHIRRFNASADHATAATMARDIVAGDWDIIITVSTPAVQSMATANRAGRIRHVFGTVTDPIGSGIGITGPEPGRHPPHMAGIGTFQPVEDSFDTARRLSPSLRRVGVVWSPAEHNSEACVLKARAHCRKTGIELIEANASTSSEVPEAVRSLLTRDVDAIWIGGDTVAISALSTIVSAARGAHMPVFTNDPSDAGRGALFGLGASYVEIGRTTGAMAVSVLRGADLRTFPTENVVPRRLGLNKALLDTLGPVWSAPADILEQAGRAAASAAGDNQSPMASCQSETGNPQSAAGYPQSSVGNPPSALHPSPGIRTPAPGRTYRIGLLYYAPDPLFDDTMEGIRQGLADAGFIEGANLILLRAHPSADMSSLPLVIRNLLARDIDLLMPMSTPCLAGVCSIVRDRPVVFSVVTEPVGAGAGRSFTDHLPNITGVAWNAPRPGVFTWLRRLRPEARRIGTIYNTSEANSRTEAARLREMLPPLGLELEERTITSPGEINEAVTSLFARGVDAIFGMGDNMMMAGHPAVAAACLRHHIPFLADDASIMGTGGLISCGTEPLSNGRQAGRLAARILLGDDPSAMPFEHSAGIQTTLDFDAASRLGITLPPALLREAAVFHNIHARLGRPARIAVITIMDNTALAEAEGGVGRGLRESGLVRGKDYTLQRFNAQGDMTQLPQIIDSALAGDPDLILTVSTPVLVATAHRVTSVPVVFTVASDPARVGLFAEGRPRNLTGVHDDPPVDRLLDMARRHIPGLSLVGTIYDPSQPNSLISIKKLRAACSERGLILHETTANTVADFPAAAQSLVQRGVGAILLSADNLVYTCFPAIINAARPAGIPVFATEPNLVQSGAAGAIGDDYEAWGAQSGRLAAKVLAGVPPADLPIEPTAVQKVIEPAASPQIPDLKSRISNPPPAAPSR